ncbi:MAG: T9SS type A sorting domain-containing protein [Bacteroidota bacterium]
MCDLSSNDTSFWNNPPLTWSNSRQSADLFEGSADLGLKILKCNGGGTLTISYTIFLDLDNDNLEETVIQSQNPPPPGIVFANNAFNPNYVGGDTLLYDGRHVPDSLRFRFTLQVETIGDTAFANVMWHSPTSPATYISPRLPEGKHRIVWLVKQDNVTRNCQYPFRIKDCLAPVVFCKNGVTVHIDTTTALATLYAQDLVQSVEDNATPVPLLQLAIRRGGAGADFPLDSLGQSIQQILYHCYQGGAAEPVELWVRDKAGNTTFCETTITVLDNPIACPTILPKICAAPCWNPNGNLLHTIFRQSWAYSDSQAYTRLLPKLDGCGTLDSIPGAPTFTLAPNCPDIPINGISTFDLLLISKHILGVTPFDAPWKMLAADVNGSGSVTTFDIVLLRKLLLGIIDTLPNDAGWHFYPADCQYPTNPFAGWCPSVLTLNSMPLGNYESKYLFYAYKTGDVNGSAKTDSLALADDRASIALIDSDVSMAAGQVTDVPVLANTNALAEGFQFALQYDPALMEVLEIVPGDLPGMDVTSFGRPKPGSITVSWFNTNPVQITAGQTLFYLRIHTRAKVDQAQAFVLQNSLLAPEVYGVTDERIPLQLKVGQAVTGSSISDPQPNPTSGETAIIVQTADAVQATIELVDCVGRTVYTNEAFLAPGQHKLTVPATSMSMAGVYFWRVKIGAQSKSGRLVKF